VTWIAGIGLLTTLMETAATSIGAGILVGGFVTSGVGMVAGRTRKEIETRALRDAFYGSLGGIFCLCHDFLMRMG
jgi:hypothetical protein